VRDRDRAPRHPRRAGGGAAMSTGGENGNPARGAGSAGPGANATSLYVARLADPRERAAVPREGPRGRAARKAETTTDVTSFHGVLLAGLVGAAAALAAFFLEPPPGGALGLASPGPLARPHVNAKLECTSCHAPADDARVAGSKSSKPLLPNACA